jgi:hypothetical protein
MVYYKFGGFFFIIFVHSLMIDGLLVMLRNKYHNLKLANIFDLRSTAAKNLLKDPRHNLAEFYYTRIRILIT